MYCIRCGKEISELALNCPHCGAVQVEDASPSDTEQLPRPASTPVTVSLTKRNWAKLLLIGALLCFFLPFAAISCSDEKTGRTVYSQSVSGFEMMKLSDNNGLNLREEEPDPMEEILKRLPGIFSITAFAAGVIAVVLLFLGKSARAAGWLAVLASVCTLLLGLFFFLLYSPLSPISVYSMTDQSAQAAEALKIIRIKIKPGLPLALTAFIAGAVFCFRERPPEEFY